jgi:hypothetical protein
MAGDTMTESPAEEDRSSRWWFYIKLLLGVPKALWNASDWWSRIVELVLLAGFLIPPLSDAFRKTLTANLYLITFVSFLGLLLFGILESSHEVLRGWEKRAREAEHEAAGFKKQLAGRQSRVAIREALGSLLMEGQELQRRCADEREAPPSAEAEEWAEKTEACLSEQLDPSYIARFRSHAGIPMAACSISSIEHRNLWAGLQVRLARLTQFVEELSQ